MREQKTEWWLSKHQICQKSNQISKNQKSSFEK